MTPSARSLLRTTAACLSAALIQAFVFFIVPHLNMIYDGWPRGWLVLSTSVLAGLFGGLAAGLSAISVGAGLIWWFGTTFTPMHPGLEVFVALGVLQLVVIHRLTQHTQALHASQATFAKSFHGNAAGMVITRARDGLVLDVNDAYVRLSGYSRRALVGGSAVSIWKYAADREPLTRRLAQEGSVTNYEATAVRKNGEEWTALVSAQVTGVDGEQVIISSVLDISDRKRGEEALREADRVKDQFLAVLSHELRTPLNVILGYSRMLAQQTPSSEEARKVAQIIERNAVAQLHIVEDLLDVQRVLREGLKIEPHPFLLEDAAHPALDSLKAQALAKGIHWAADFEDLVIDGDRGRIQQVLWNLVSNAVKFTPPGGCIGITGAREDHDVVIRVSDSGEGIAPEFLPYVFEPFRQHDMSTTRRHGGLGLGLAIVKHIVEAHGGTVDVQSEMNKGSEFIIRLPIRLDRETAA